MVLKIFRYFFILATICFSTPGLYCQQVDSIVVLDLTLEELLNAKIITASNLPEEQSKAPANVIVLDKSDIQLRGYTCLNDIFDDLPGIDVSKPFGFQRSRDYWRGYRTPFGDSYLLLVDGLVQNHLWYNEAISLSAMPLSNIERIEIVYGPASSVYGANAFMGVVNVITIKDKHKDGTSANLMTNLGKNSFNGDYNYFYKKDEFRLSISSRFETWNLFDRIDNTAYEWTKTSLLTDSNLWGGLVQNQHLSAVPSVKNHGIDIRAFFGNLELGFQFNKVDQGYGMIFPYDKSLASEQPMSDYSIFLSHQYKLGDRLFLNSLLRYRKSTVDGECNFIEGDNKFNNDTIATLIGGIWVRPGEGTRVVSYSTWGVLNYSYTINQSVEYEVKPGFLFSIGIKYEYKDLQKHWQNKYGAEYAPSVLELGSPGFLVDPMVLQRQHDNRIVWHDIGGFFQMKYSINSSNTLNLGSRLDRNSVYGTNITLRGAYVLSFDKFTAKLLYGDAFREPSPQTLYGEWKGIGDDPYLKPEHSRTFEGIISYTLPNFSALVDAYYVINSNTIESVTDKAQNLGKRDITGIDLHAVKALNTLVFKHFKFWAYGSFILKEKQQYFDSLGISTKMDRIGDLAHVKIYTGVSGNVTGHLSFSVRGRYIGERNTILSNPIKSVDRYYLLDGNFMYKDFLTRGLSLTLQVNNIFNAQYFHPGTRDARAGNNSGYWDGDVWYGSNGWNNSLMPQPHRYSLLGIQFNF